MKVTVAVVLALVAVVAAAPAEEVPPAILRSNFDQAPEGGYNFGFETENGISRQETGEIKTVTDDEKVPHPVVVVRGSYAYTDKEGNVETINYVADENGFRAEGPSIPKAPEARR